MRPTCENDAVAMVPTLQVYKIVGADEKLVPIASKGLMSAVTTSSTTHAVVESSSSSSCDEASVSSCAHDSPTRDQAPLVSSPTRSRECDSKENNRAIDARDSIPIEELSPKPILKRSFSLQEIPVVARRSSWKQLPVPDLERIRHSSCPTTSCDTDDSKLSTVPERKQRRATVTFDSIQIREYNQTVGDNPAVSMGPPITLDWSFSELDPISVNEYEDHRGTRRTLRQMMMSYHHRRKVLMWLYGATEQQVEEATRVANQWKRQRALTHILLPYQKVEEILQSAQRKAKRFQERRKSTALTTHEDIGDLISNNKIAAE